MGRVRSTAEMVGAVRRMIRAAGRHVGGRDEFELAELAELRDELDDVIQLAVTSQRTQGKTRQQIGDALGVRRQSAQERYGAPADVSGRA